MGSRIEFAMVATIGPSFSVSFRTATHSGSLTKAVRQQEMAKPYSQDLRDRVIDAVERGKMSRRAAGRHYAISESVAIKWLERLERHGSREPVGHGGHRASKLMPHRNFLEAARTEKSDITLQALCDRSRASRIART